MNHYTEECSCKAAEKTPLGCRPYYIAASDRIEELATAIHRQATTQCNVTLIKKWADEIVAQCELMEKLQNS